MGSEEFSRPVRGSGSDPVSTTQQGSFTTDNFPEGDSIDIDEYPAKFNADDDYDMDYIEEFGIYSIGDDIEIDVTLDNGTEFTLKPHGANQVIECWEIESLEFTDPDDTGDETHGYIALEGGGGE